MAFVGIVGGIAAGAVSVIAVVKGERSLVLVAPVLVGALAVVFVVGEFVSPP